MPITGPATLAWIPALPLIVATSLGVASGLLRRSLSDRSVAAVTSAGFAGSFLLSLLFFARLVSGGIEQPIVERMGSWFGLGVAAEALDVAFILRLDPLSSLFCLLASGVAFAIQLHSGIHMSRSDHDDGGLQRFCAYTSALLASVLLFVLAEDMLLAFAAWVGCGLFTRLLVGFWYGETHRMAALQKVALRQRAGDALFLAGILTIFWQLVNGGGADLSWSGLRAAGEALQSLPPASQVAVEAGIDVESQRATALFTALLFVGAAASRLFVLPFVFGLRAAALAPSPASALIQAVAMPCTAVLLLVRLASMLQGLPGLATGLCWAAGIGALLFVVASLTEDDGRNVLTWTTASQLSIAALAVGLGAYDAAVFQVMAHAFAKALLFLGIATASKARGHTHDRSKHAPLGLAMLWPRTFTLLGGLTMAGLPPTIAFFAYEQLLDAADRAIGLPGHALLGWLLIATVFTTALSVVRLYYIVFPARSSFEPARRRLPWEPHGPSLWSLGALAAFCAFGGVFGVSQIFGDPFEIEQMNSLSAFLAPVVPNAVPTRGELGGQSGWIALQILAMVSGAVLARLLFRSREELAMQVRDGLRGPARRAVDLLDPDRLFERVVVTPGARIARAIADGPVGERLLSALLDRGPAFVVDRWVTTAQRWTQAGYLQGYVVTMLAGALFVVLVLTLGEVLQG
jgi:NADH-quinone oxidoreductase subunit L